MRVRSRRSSIKRASSAMLRSIMPSCSRASAGSRSSARSAAAVISTGVSGVRNSCESAARKSSFARAGPLRVALRGLEIVNVGVGAEPLAIAPRYPASAARADDEPSVGADRARRQSELDLVVSPLGEARCCHCAMACAKSSGCTNCAQAFPEHFRAGLRRRRTPGIPGSRNPAHRPVCGRPDLKGDDLRQ